MICRISVVPTYYKQPHSRRQSHHNTVRPTRKCAWSRSKAISLIIKHQEAEARWGTVASGSSSAASLGSYWSRLHIVDDKMINEYGAFGRIRIGRGSQSVRRNLTQCPQLILHDVIWNRNKAAAVGSRRLHVCAMTPSSAEPLMFNSVLTWFVLAMQ
jgi:hypothetical protein